MSSDVPDEQVDLTVTQRERIDQVFGQLDGLDDYAVIGVAPGADRAAVRRAYFERVAEFHTDRFFRRSLGSYKAKMDAIARRVTQAYESLAGTDRRTGGSSARWQAAAAAPPAQPAPDPAREKALANLKQQLEARRAEARRLLDEAQRAAARGNLDGAVEASRKALALAPNDRAIQTAHEQARKAANAAAADALKRQAEFEEKFGHWAEAAATWRRIVDARPEDSVALDRLAHATARAGLGDGAPGGRSGA